MEFKNESFIVNDDPGKPSILYFVSVILVNLVFLTVCGGLIFIAKKFLKSIPPGRKLVCTDFIGFIYKPKN